MADRSTPISAARLAEQLGDQLPAAHTIPPESFELVSRIRELVEAVVLTDAPESVRAAAADEIASITERLGAEQRASALLLVRHADGRVESLAQAGSGRLNPQAPPLEFVEFGDEVVARCTLTAAHGGSPSRAHGSVVATLLDEVLGRAVTDAGASGLTVSLEVSYRAATPYGVPLEIRGRLTGRDGRKSFASGEVYADGVVTAVGEAVYVGERR
ncbi:MAG: PaaI family thioesterase [Acidimicrobiia bacterium]